MALYEQAYIFLLSFQAFFGLPKSIQGFFLQKVMGERGSKERLVLVFTKVHWRRISKEKSELLWNYKEQVVSVLESFFTSWKLEFWRFETLH